MNIYTDLIIDISDGPLSLTVHLEEEDIQRLISLFRAKDVKVEDDRDGPRLRWEKTSLEMESYGRLSDDDFRKVVHYCIEHNAHWGDARQSLLDLGEIHKI